MKRLSTLVLVLVMALSCTAAMADFGSVEAFDAMFQKIVAGTIGIVPTTQTSATYMGDPVYTYRFESLPVYNEVNLIGNPINTIECVVILTADEVLHGTTNDGQQALGLISSNMALSAWVCDHGTGEDAGALFTTMQNNLRDEYTTGLIPVLNSAMTQPDELFSYNGTLAGYNAHFISTYYTSDETVLVYITIDNNPVY